MVAGMRDLGKVLRGSGATAGANGGCSDGADGAVSPRRNKGAGDDGYELILWALSWWTRRCGQNIVPLRRARRGVFFVAARLLGAAQGL